MHNLHRHHTPPATPHTTKKNAIDYGVDMEDATDDAMDAEAAVGNIAFDDDAVDVIMADNAFDPFARIVDIIGNGPSTIVATFLGLQTLTLNEYHIRMFLILLSADYQKRGNFSESLYWR